VHADLVITYSWLLPSALTRAISGTFLEIEKMGPDLMRT